MSGPAAIVTKLDGNSWIGRYVSRGDPPMLGNAILLRIAEVGVRETLSEIFSSSSWRIWPGRPSMEPEVTPDTLRTLEYEYVYLITEHDVQLFTSVGFRKGRPVDVVSVNQIRGFDVDAALAEFEEARRTYEASEREIRRAVAGATTLPALLDVANTIIRSTPAFITAFHAVSGALQMTVEERMMLPPDLWGTVLARDSNAYLHTRWDPDKRKLTCEWVITRGNLPRHDYGPGTPIVVVDGGRMVRKSSE